MKIIAIVQARMNSTRLPGKVMLSVNSHSIIGVLLKRLSKSQTLDDIIVATTNNRSDDVLVDHVTALGFKTYRGSEHDVLQRYYSAALQERADVVVRITADCPLIDSVLLDQVIMTFSENELDYCSNREPATYPDGLDVEVFSFNALEKANEFAFLPHDREHVTPYIIGSDNFKKSYVKNGIDFSRYRWTLDYPEDFEVISAVFKKLDPDIYFSWETVLELERSNPAIFAHNKNIERNDGAQKSSGIKLWERAQKVIPGGNMLLSKRSEMYLPGTWPTYFSKAKGCEVWDLDGNKFVDMCLMGVGTNILGYGHPEIDRSVSNVVKHGNMSTLNCPEEVNLAERLVEMHPWAHMVRFARTGGEANAIAIRIARAASGKQKVAICGYHGWHDWYLAANLADSENLDGHLLPGLNPTGVPRELMSSTLAFEYNKIEQLENLIAKHDIGVIKMEVSRNEQPSNNFLGKVRKLATDNGIVLIFDECSSGFRQSFGGLHKYYNIEPDMAIFGKALGNGYAITAVIGKRDVMDAAQNTFISSTFWTERIGPAAGLKTLDVMEREQSWNIITEAGNYVSNQWQALANQYNLSIKLSGLASMKSFSFNSPDSLKYKTLITQEMLKKGFLATNTIYMSTSHSQKLIALYLENLEEIFSKIATCESGTSKIDDLLDGPICHAGFQRLN